MSRYTYKHYKFTGDEQLFVVDIHHLHKSLVHRMIYQFDGALEDYWDDISVADVSIGLAWQTEKFNGFGECKCYIIQRADGSRLEFPCADYALVTLDQFVEMATIFTDLDMDMYIGAVRRSIWRYAIDKEEV